MKTKKGIRKSSNANRATSRPARAPGENYVQLPKSLKGLSQGYRALVRELSKR